MSRRICIVSDSPHFVPPFTVGGSVGQLLLLADALQAAGSEVLVAARTPAGQHPAVTRYGTEGRDIAIRYLGPGGENKGRGWAALLPSLGFIASVLRFLLTQGGSFDGIVVSGFRLLAVPVALVARVLRKPCVVRIEDAHDLTMTLREESSAKMGMLGRTVMHAVLKSLYWMGFRLPLKVVAFSPDIASSLNVLGAPKRKIATIPNGIDRSKFHPATAEVRQARRTSLGLPMEKHLFVYVGRLTRSKGFMNLIRAWTLLAKERRDVMLVVLGEEGGQDDGCETEAKQELAQAGVEASVSFRGPVINVADYLQAADAFVSLSKGETFGLSILEALATGLPAMTTRVGVVKQLEAVAGWGYVVDVESSDLSVLEKLRSMLDAQSQWSSMGEVASRLVKDQFSIQSVAERYLEVLSPA